MKYLVRVLAGLLVAVVAALLIVPAAVNWNRYRAEIATKASYILGRPVEIRGDIDVALLPVPMVTIERANLGNIEGASDADMLSLDALEVKIAWAPLLVGNVRIEAVRLVRPVFNIEIFENGESNLVLQPREPDAVQPSPGAPPSLPITGMRVTPKNGGGFDISIENFVVEKGTLVYRNALKGIEERIDDLNGRVAFASLKGPMDASASGIVHGLPIAIEMSAGEIIQGRTMPFNLDATIAPGGMKAQFSGSLNGLDDLLRLRGRLTAEGENLGAFVSALGAQKVPDALRRPFGIQSNVTLAADGADLTDLVLKLDGAQAQGRVTAQLADKPIIDATFTLARIDLDTLMRMPAPAKPTAAKTDPAPAPAVTRDLPDAASGAAPGGFSLETLPADLTANVAVSIDTLVWRGDAVRQAKLDLSLANREITVSQLSALFPGNSDVAIFGFVTEKDDMPQFDGTLEATGSDLRGTLAWLGAPVKGIAADRLRNLNLTARLSVRPDQASASELKAKFDATQIDGALTASFAQRPSFGANLAIDRINVDDYTAAQDMPAATALPNNAAPAPAAPAGASVASATDTLGALSAFGGFDATLRARIGAATVKGLPASDMRIEASVVDGNLDIKSASVADLAGLAASVSGGIAGLDAKTASADARVHDLVFDLKGKSLTTFFRLAEIKSPVSPETLGPIAVTARFDGPLRALDLASEIQAMGGRSSLTGRLDTRALLPRFDAKVALVHPDIARLVRGLGYDWRPRGAKGGIDLNATLTGSLTEVGMSALTGSVAGVRIQGSGAARWPLLGGGRKPLIALNVKTGDLDLDSFLQQKRTAALESAPSDRDAKIQPAAFRMPAMPRMPVVQVAAAAGGRDSVWSNEPLDLSLLTAFDGSFAVKSDALRLGGVSIANADLDAELQNGLFEIRHLTGKTFGGDLNVDGGVAAESAGPGGRFELRYALNNADVSAADRAFGAKNAASGNATLDGQLSGRGKSPADLIASLSGEGALAFRGIDGSQGQGSMLGAIGGISQSLERLGGLRGRLEPVAINLSGPYRVENGIVGFDELAFTSPIADGTLKGKADLPRWQIAATGEIRLAKDFVIGGGSSKPVPFALDGALDAPRLKVDIAALPGGGIQIPMDKLKTKKGAKELLRDLIPRKSDAPTAPVPPPTPSAPVASAPLPAPGTAAPKADVKAEPKAEAKPEPKKGERVEDILKDILRGVSR